MSSTKSFKNIVLFMGQLREIENFKKQLVTLSTLKKEGLIDEIYYVTDEFSVPSEMKSYLFKKDVKVLEKAALTDSYLMRFDPDLLTRSEKLRKVSGGIRAATIWRQLYDLDYALKHIDPESRVLRTRTDIYLEESFLKVLLRSENQRKVDVTAFNIFEEKIWVQWFSLNTPFYIHDSAFYGLWRDLRRLVDSDINIELAKYYPTASLPIFFWILPFYRKSEKIKVWLEKYSKERFSIYNLDDRRYLEIFLEYYRYVQSNFYVYYGDVKWILQWNPGVYEKRIWKAADSSADIPSNLCKGLDGQCAIESSFYLGEFIEGYEKFVANNDNKNIKYQIKKYFWLLKLSTKKILRGR